MPKIRKNSLEQNAADDLWKHTLSQIPTVYGRLAYLSALRDPNSGIYRHHGLAALFGRDESSRALRESHEQVFLSWIGLSMREKKLDLGRHFSTLDEPAPAVLEYLIRSRSYTSQSPASVPAMERELFCTDLEVLLETIRNGLSAGDSDPVPSQRE